VSTIMVCRPVVALEWRPRLAEWGESLTAAGDASRVRGGASTSWKNVRGNCCLRARLRARRSRARPAREAVRRRNVRASASFLLLFVPPFEFGHGGRA
jgi:hypothetical protein